MTILTHNLYPFVVIALREAGHQVITADSHKLEKMYAKYQPDKSIIFGWDKNCVRFIETHSPVFLHTKHQRFLNRAFATRALDDVALEKYPKRWYIASSEQSGSRAAEYGEFITKHDQATGTWVMKWGDSHQGKDKRLVTKPSINLPPQALPKEELILEPFVEGRSIRVLIINGKVWKIEHINRKNWIKNVDPEEEILNPNGVPQEMINQTMAVSTKYSLDMIAVDFQLGKDGRIFPLEINVMPGIPEDDGIKKAYTQYFLDLVK